MQKEEGKKNTKCWEDDLREGAAWLYFYLSMLQGTQSVSP